MSGIDPNDEMAILSSIKELAMTGQYLLTDHADARMDKHGVALTEILEALTGARLLENYPTYRHGPCCLVYGDTNIGHPLHLVCSTTLSNFGHHHCVRADAAKVANANPEGVVMPKSCRSQGCPGEYDRGGAHHQSVTLP